MLHISNLVNLVLLPCVIGYHAFNLVMIAIGLLEIRRLRCVAPRLMAESARESGELLPVSIIVPAFNEERVIARTVESLLSLRYPEYEVLVISDGSEDRTLEVLTERFALEWTHLESTRDLMTERIRGTFRSAPEARLLVVDKRNGGKADALNAGINLARFPLVLAVDADVTLDPDALAHLAIPFAVDPDTVATSGMIRPQNGCRIERGVLVTAGVPRTWLERFQVVEYLRAYGIGRMFFNRFNAHLIISGAFGLFSRRLLLDLGGYQTHAVGEDIELVVRAHRHLRQKGTPYRMAFSPDALCLTEAPHALRDLGNQRTRWHQGLLGTLRLHRSMCGRRRYGAAGTLAFPYFVAELFFPVVECIGWVVLPLLWLAGWVNTSDVVRFTLVAVLLGSSVSFAALAVEALTFSFFPRWTDRLWLVGAALGEHLGFRQWTIYFRLRAFVRYYRTLQLRSAWRPPTRKASPPRPSADRNAA